nr:phospholipase D-like domain-containing protein [Kovacikia minuta]
MNQNPASSYTEPYRNQTRSGDNLEQKIIETIATAQSSIDVAVQELRLPKLVEALVERQRAGVKVRVILENTYSRPFSEFTSEEVAKLPERERGRFNEFRQLVDRDGDGQLSQAEINQADALVMLDRARIPRIDDTADGSAGSNLMHHKFVVVDGRSVIVTSANFTTSDVHGDFKSPHSRGNANNLLKIDSPELATMFIQEFNLMWGDGPGGKPDSKFGTKKPFRAARSVMVGSTAVEVQFSPTKPSVSWSRSTNGLIGKTLTTATRSIEMALFVFSDQQLVNLLEPVHDKGVEIRTLIEPGFAYRSYSEGLDMMGITLTEDCKGEAGNRPWQNPIATVGVPRLPPGDLLHNKFGIVDQQTVVTGSHNWTDAANTGNDETLLVVHNPVVAAHYLREFDRLYANAVLGIPPAIRKKATAQTKQCPPPTQMGQTTLPANLPNPSSPAIHQVRVASKPLRQTASAPSLKLASRRNQSPDPQSFNQRVNLNTATQAELDALPGVGPGLAKRIIAARQQHPFRSLQDLDQVSGVGPKLLKKLEAQVTW